MLSTRHDDRQPSTGQSEDVDRQFLVSAVVDGQPPVIATDIHLRQTDRQTAG